MKKYLLFTIVLIFSFMISIAIFNKNAVDDIKTHKIEIEFEEREQAGKLEEKIVEAGYEEVERFLDEEYLNNRFQGVALIAQGDEIKFAKAYGYADEEKSIENKLTTRFAIASNTKQFTASAIMQLVDDGKIDVNQTIDKYFPEYKYSNKITIKHLLQMRSGIPDYLNEVEVYMRDDEAVAILDDYKDNPYFDKYVEDIRWSKDIILNNLYLSELYFDPGSSYDYCNTNYYLLGLIIEKESGLSFEEYIKKNIFIPTNMESSSMLAVGSDAKGHGSENSGSIAANTNFTYSAGNIYANVYDILRWNRMLHKGDIISKASYKEMTTPQDDYGYGLFIKGGIISHSGVIDGFNSNTQYDMKNDITIIVMENLDANTQGLDAKYDTSIIRGLIH